MLDWTITCWPLQSDTHHERIEFRAAECSSPEPDFAIGPAAQVADTPRLAAFGEEHPLAARLMRSVGSRAGGLLALSFDGTPAPLGSTGFQKSFGALASHGGTVPVQMTVQLERLFLQWPEPLSDPGNKVSAWRDAKGLHVQVLCDSGPPWELFEHLAELGVALAEATTRS
jgi:hypothetical protein